MSTLSLCLHLTTKTQRGGTAPPLPTRLTTDRQPFQPMASLARST